MKLYSFAILLVVLVLTITEAKRAKGKGAKKLLRAAEKVEKEYFIKLADNLTRKQVRDHIRRTRELFNSDDDDTAGEETTKKQRKECKVRRRSKLAEIGKFKGYTITCFKESELEQILEDDAVEIVEENQVYTIDMPAEEKEKNNKNKGKGKGKGKGKPADDDEIEASGSGSEEEEGDDDEEAEQTVLQLGETGSLEEVKVQKLKCKDRPKCACRKFNICPPTATISPTLSTSPGTENGDCTCTCAPTTGTTAPPTTSGTTAPPTTATTAAPTTATAAPTTTAPPTAACGADIVSCVTRTNFYTWGIDRLDQATSSLDQTFRVNGIGTGVDAYIVDTGVRYTHNEFCGRVERGINTVYGSRYSANDDNGHGTHVAGTVGGKLVGVAQDVTIIPVKVLSSGGSGSTSSIVNGINWCVQQYRSRGRKAVINMSLGCLCTNSVMNSAIQGAIDEGITVVVAAGNSNTDACRASPAQIPDAVTVASSTNTDARSSFSNYGSCVDIYAPGSSILSASHYRDNYYRSLSGTSMAAPHVAGVVASYLSTTANEPTPAEVSAWLASGALSNQISGHNSGINDLLQANQC